ncbi:MAG: DNA binding protein containing RHH/copG family domain [Candidatus Methanohalarchaeum thermophilum]|uniref:DNA binding protein containing RHH/copG family domain n=1 Tax=Methanohalarchaeum thermophilum TaxID=1903181 RepID=A0A1Q6DSX0_METT1|nr:MAG: DNA binding protein containing RHH/copG family domain [Candidatus Methanohalarchaeum thermophilum]
MPSKNISIKEEAYKRLKELKDKEKSFSDVILELTEKNKKDFSNIIGKNIDISWEEIKETRKRTEEDEDREKLLFRH